MVKLQQLLYFQEVAREGNITQAARRLYISQPSLSAAISALEGELNLPLFHRSANAIALTDAGRVFLQYVDQIFAILDKGVQEAARAAGREGSKLTIATSLHLTMDIWREYMGKNPHAHVNNYIHHNREIQKLLRNGTIDLAITLGEIQDDRISSQLLLEGPTCLMVRTDHRLACRETITRADLQGENVMTCRVNHSRQWVDQVFAGMELPHVMAELTEREEYRRAAEDGLGGVFVPDIPWIADGCPLKLLPITDLPLAGIYLCYAKNRPLTPAAADFRKFVLAYFLRHQSGKSA